MNILIIPKIKIQNANALSSALTVGFPAMTAWGGAVHALERHVREKLNAIKFTRFSVVCHQFDMHAYKGRGDYVYSLIGMGFPLDKDGKRASFVEEARCNLTVSLAIEYLNNDHHEKADIISFVQDALKYRLKMAGGDILQFNEPEIYIIQDETAFKKLKRKLMPGYFLTERRDLVSAAMNSGSDALEAVLAPLKIKNKSQRDKDTEEVIWDKTRQHKGWIVPIAVGFQALTPLLPAKHQRDNTVPHCFAEAVVTLGEFKMVHRINDFDEFFWSFAKNIENGLYVCVQENSLN